MIKKNKFSIIIPVYNVEAYLHECFDSVVKQTYDNYEVIIVCDKCTDNSEKIVDEYVKRHKKFSKIYEENTGLGLARNIGIEKSSGDYLVFLDSDDYLQPDFLEVINSELQEKVEVLRIQAQDIHGEETIKHAEVPFDVMSGSDAFDLIFRYHYIENSWCYIYNRNFWVRNRFEFMPGCIAEDYGLTPLILAKATTVKGISYIGYNYRYRDNSLMNKKEYTFITKKMDDMLKQAKFIKAKLKGDSYNPKIDEFLNNSLIYYSTTLKYKDYRRYTKVLKELGYYDHFKRDNLKSNIKVSLIKTNAYLFHRYIKRFIK